MLKKHLLFVLRKMIFVGLSIQIIWGMVWLIANFTEVQPFPEINTFELGNGDGILYHGLLFVFRRVGILFGEAWYCFVYLLQLITAFLANRFMVVSLAECVQCRRSGLWETWFVLGMLTIPSAMQCHLALLPNSLTGSLFMIMLALGVVILRNKEHNCMKEMALVGVLWIIIGFMMPEYRLFGGIVFGAVTIRKLLASKGNVNFLLLFAAFCGMLFCLAGVMQKESMPEGSKNSVSLKAVSRFVWPDFQEYHGMWPDEIKNAISWEEAGVISRTADGIQTVFAPMMEQALGEKEAEKAYWKLVGTAAHIRTRDIVENIVWDGACHIFSPYLLTKQLEGVGYQSYSGRNYEIMKAHTPGITKHYIAYEGWWFVTGIVVAALISIITINDKRKSLLAGKGLLIVSALVMVIYYTMQGAGVMDYKQTIYVTVLWTLWMCSHAMPDKAEM